MSVKDSTAAGTLIPDPWLGERLGVPAFTLPPDADPGQVPKGPAFIQAKVETTRGDRLGALVRCGYDVIEVAVTLECDIARTGQAPGHVRFSQPADEAAVRAIAGAAFQHSRFHGDPRIPAEVANRIKADWAGNFFTGGRGTHMVVSTQGSAPTGFLLLIQRGEQLVIDLVGVAPGLQGQGFGRAMLQFAAQEVAAATRYVVGTQLQNVAALAYYTGYGFRVRQSNYTLHRHIH